MGAPYRVGQQVTVKSGRHRGRIGTVVEGIESKPQGWEIPVVLDDEFNGSNMIVKIMANDLK